jgi:hypothetical protein
MISKLPRWIWAGAWTLAFVGGMVNVVGLLGFEHQAVTHRTGTTFMLAAAIASLDGAGAFHFAGVIGAFVTGTVLSGFLIQDSTLQLGRRYGVLRGECSVASRPLRKTCGAGCPRFFTVGHRCTAAFRPVFAAS